MGMVTSFSPREVNLVTTQESEFKLEETTKPFSSEAELLAIRNHVEEIIRGPAFRGSRRSAQFLQYIVEHAISHRNEALREREIGIELFDRRPHYDTNDDAIVRVTASDVRKRLSQHYSLGKVSDFRIDLHPGGYVPEIHLLHPISRDVRPLLSGSKEQAPPPANPSVPKKGSNVEVILPAIKEVPMAELPSKPVSTTRPIPLKGVLSFGAIAFIAAFVCGLLVRRPQPPPPSKFLWPPLLSGLRPLQIVTSDPNIAEIAGLTKHPISVSDYANRQYGCEVLTTDLRFICEKILRGDKAAGVDVMAVAQIGAFVQRYSGEFEIHTARTLQMSDLRSDGNYLLLGSPRSDPWAALFSDQMDFHIAFDPLSNQDVVIDTDPRSGELPVYKPTAKGLGTGQSYAIIGFVQNLSRGGGVLLLEGADAEGTLAAADLVANESSLYQLRRRCNLSDSANKHFSALIRVGTMAEAPTRSEVIACHIAKT